MVDNLSNTAKKILEAADREDWESLGIALAELQKNALNRRYTMNDSSDISSTLESLQAAISQAQRRRDEIRDLVNKISDAPL